MRARAIFDGSSSIKTISAASIAASEPSAPIAIPISARDNTGASFIPSPTKASFFLGDFSPSNFSTHSTLSAGRSSAWYSSRPRFSATILAVSFESPVSITVLSIPLFLRLEIAFFELSLTTSDITMQPAYTPSQET